MPKIEEYAEITVAGQRYRDWKTVAVERTHGEVAMRAMFTVAEVSSRFKTWAAQKIRLDDPATVSLAGKLVIRGVVEVRQPAYNAQQHGLQIGVVSENVDIVNSSIDAKTGQFKDYPLSAIANAVLAPFGVSFEMRGSPAGADKSFDRVNVMVGESPWHLIERLARMRNVFLMPNEDGTGLIGHRGSIGSAGAQLVEGKNIEYAQCLLKDDSAFNKISVLGQKKGSDDVYGDDLRVSASASNPSIRRNRPLILIAEEPGDKQDMQFRADRNMAENVATTIECTIGVKGWLCDDGSIWTQHVGKLVSVYSPMLFPDDMMTLAIRSVRCTQDDSGGTATAIALCRPEALGTAGGTGIGVDGPGGGGQPATPDGDDS
jgi:prophage tail gpP-like protein